MLDLIIFTVVFLFFGGLLAYYCYDRYIKPAPQKLTWWISLAVMEIILFCLFVLPSIIKLK